MQGFAFSSYRYEQDQQLLEMLRSAILAVKRQAQDLLVENQRGEINQNSRHELINFLIQLEATVAFLYQGESSSDINLSLASLADKFIKVNPNDVEDRVAQITRMRARLVSEEQLLDRDFQLLDRLQSLLEDVVVQGIEALFRF